jgi:hypothetical protein
MADAILRAGPQGSPGMVYGRTSMSVVCSVSESAVRAALDAPETAVRLGTWLNRDLYGYIDDWGIWGAQSLCWAATSEVTEPRHAQVLIDDFVRQVEVAEREGRVYRPVPPRHGRRHAGVRIPTDGFWGAFWDGALGRQRR